jgi:FKBP-type peptidyl-prolyl cis-trans isomerase
LLFGVQCSRFDVRDRKIENGKYKSLNSSFSIFSWKERFPMAIRKRVVAVHGRERMAKAQKNKQEGQAFLQENGKREGVVTLPSGLQYRVIEEGEGSSPGPADSVTVHYRGTLIDGTEFDSSYSRGQAATFQIKGVIIGWYEGLQLMREGSKWELFVPSDLAYGIQGTGSGIGPNSTLIFEVELISVDG